MQQTGFGTEIEFALLLWKVLCCVSPVGVQVGETGVAGRAVGQCQTKQRASNMLWTSTDDHLKAIPGPGAVLGELAPVLAAAAMLLCVCVVNSLERGSIRGDSVVMSGF